MKNISNISWILGACIAALPLVNVYSSERLLEAKVNARTEYNDNIFLTSEPHDSVTGVIITPSLSGMIKEKHWDAQVDARLSSNNYSDDSLNSNDQYFDLIGHYNAERNIFALNMNHDLDSNLRSTSTDFGITGVRVNRKSQSISPQYTRLLTERSALILSYVYSDVDYIEAENTGYTPYITENASASLIYNLTEKDKLTVSLQGVDYKSKNDLITYQLLLSRIGIKHEFSETLSTDFLVGVSRRDSTNLSTQTFDFFGNVIVQTQVIEAQNRGFVLDASIKQLLENGSLVGRVNRDNTTNSFGGLNQTDQIKITYDLKLSSLWSYNLSGRYDDVTAISSGTQNTDLTAFFFESIARYSVSKNWNINASYRYISRRFKSDTSVDRAPHSNRIYIGFTYNFPSLSTF